MSRQPERDRLTLSRADFVSEGIKFTCERRGDGKPLGWFGGFDALNDCRRQLLQLRLLGVDANGIGFGNLSLKDEDNFYITGSATAGIRQLQPSDCVKVVDYDFARNWVEYAGSVLPSSETLTHAAIYEAEAEARVVIHGHDLKMWRTLSRESLATSPATQYGTAEIAQEVRRLLEKREVKGRKLILMGGHEGGILAFGGDFEAALGVLLRARRLIS